MYDGSARLSIEILEKVVLQVESKLSRDWMQIFLDLKNPK